MFATTSSCVYVAGRLICTAAFSIAPLVRSSLSTQRKLSRMRAGHTQLRMTSRTFLRRQQLLHTFYAPNERAKLDVGQCHGQWRVLSRARRQFVCLWWCHLSPLRSNLSFCGVRPALIAKHFLHAMDTFSTRSNDTGSCVHLAGRSWTDSFCACSVTPALVAEHSFYTP